MAWTSRPCLISNVTEAVMDEVKIWQSRSLDEVYPILYMDALRVKVRDGGHVVNKAIYVAIGVNIEGKKEVLGLWAAQNEGAKFWLQVLTEVQNRGVKDIFIACVDGLKGFDQWRRLMVNLVLDKLTLAAAPVAKLSRRCIRRRKCSCVSSTWCGPR
jgi:transposase-like protein